MGNCCEYEHSNPGWVERENYEIPIQKKKIKALKILEDKILTEQKLWRRIHREGETQCNEQSSFNKAEYNETCGTDDDPRDSTCEDQFENLRRSCVRNNRLSEPIPISELPSKTEKVDFSRPSLKSDENNISSKATKTSLPCKTFPIRRKGSSVNNDNHYEFSPFAKEYLKTTYKHSLSSPQYPLFRDNGDSSSSLEI
ncbi:unnamed protein product [Moneuplotes crassus]|uniref:Uncharacterized protein n=1 Tax=Euplotes crassus TaxID=5936 RepID=A0AAD1XY54_EUPCR|nr:unnamed protein product [Moneuplotes crassus]